ncbi:MAG: xylA2 [Acidobacteria bacterium]|nr:xylA2 [Acidobacteriota bacterium]
MSYFIGEKEFFPGIPAIAYEGRDSSNPLSFKFYDPGKRVLGKTMAEHLRFAVAYWHTFCAGGADQFGDGTRVFPWDSAPTPLDRARQKLDAAFEFFTKLGVSFYCFHDRDIAPAGATVGESEKNLQVLVALAKERQQATGVGLLWGTANLFSHPRYMNGAATSPDFRVVTHAAAQVKAAIDATVALGGQGYVFWGGREGYTTLLNTDMKRELENMARFLALARDYGRKNGFTGTFYIEPKPMEPSKHQYDFDAATVIGFLRAHGLDKDFKGDPQNGWDTDQFPTDLYQAAEAMAIVLRAGGFTTGGLNFDAHVRRNSTDAEDLFLAHIGGMDTFARGLEIAARLLEESPLKDLTAKRYASFSEGDGLRFSRGELTLADLAALAATHEDVPRTSGKQELIENVINQYL